MIRAATRRPSDMPSRLRYDNIVPVDFDWAAPASLDELVSGTDALLVVPPTGHDPLPTATHLVKAAVGAGVTHVVFVSTFGAHLEPGFAFGRWARAAERQIERTGIPVTVLRPNSYMSNFVGMLRPSDDGALRLPWA